MKIIIEETITSTIKTGVGKHTIMLNDIISNSGIEFEIVQNNFIKEINNPLIKRIVYFFWLNTFFLFKILKQKEDTKIIYTSFLPLIKINNIEQIGIIHDVLVKIYPQAMTKMAQINNILLNKSIIANADKILTVSDTVKKDIEKYYSISPERIHVIYNTFSIDNTKKNINEKYILEKFNLYKQKYLLSVSSMNKNKNIPELIKAFEKISYKFPSIKLVLTGGNTRQIKQLKMLCKHHNNIIFTGYINDEDLAVLYRNAIIYIFPSIYEGFGIPIIDAQKFGIPVICSDIPIFREVAKDSAFYINPINIHLDNVLNTILSNKELTSSKVKTGYKNIERFKKNVLESQFKKLITL